MDFEFWMFAFLDALTFLGSVIPRNEGSGTKNIELLTYEETSQIFSNDLFIVNASTYHPYRRL